jgi:hypothetical protein
MHAESAFLCGIAASREKSVLISREAAKDLRKTIKPDLIRGIRVSPRLKMILPALLTELLKTDA